MVADLSISDIGIEYKITTNILTLALPMFQSLKALYHINTNVATPKHDN